MFQNLSERLESAFKNIKGEGRITELNIAATVKDIRRALVDADVNYKIAKEFTDTVKQKAEGSKVLLAVNPGQQMVKIVQDELTELMGGTESELDLKGLPAVILIAGLQGSGKTTFSGKLANYLKTQKGKSPLLVAADIYRPAAIDQLTVLAGQIGVDVYSERENKDAVSIVQNALKEAKFELPEQEEQTAIATALSDADGLITGLEKLIAKKRNIKQGAMQQLLQPKEGWEVKKLGEVCEKKSSNISANKIVYNFGDYIIYGAAGVLKKVDFYEEEKDYVSIIKDGAGVGRIVYCVGKSSVLSTMDIIKPKIKLNTYFLYCLLENIDFTKYITGSTIPHIYFKDYRNELCGIPSLPEQTAIANFLSNLDEKINQTQRQIEKTEMWKKGLLQKMFC